MIFEVSFCQKEKIGIFVFFIGCNMSVRKYIYDIIQPAEKGSIASKIFDLFIMALIFLALLLFL